jgi:hypothetical protein
VIDFDQLLRLRVVVARFGERDNARWWNTDGQLGVTGTMVLRRNFPRSHRFAAARSVFAVAKTRCNEIFDPPHSMTLWNLPAGVEDQFASKWEGWIDAREEWEPFFGRVALLTAASDLASLLREFDLVGPEDEEAISKVRRSAEGRALQLIGTHAPNDAVIRLLALGFSKGEEGSLTIPYARVDV